VPRFGWAHAGNQNSGEGADTDDGKDAQRRAKKITPGPTRGVPEYYHFNPLFPPRDCTVLAIQCNHRPVE